MQKVDESHSHAISESQNKEIDKLIKTKTDLRIDIKKYETDLETLKVNLDELKHEENTLIKLEQIELTLKEKYSKELELEKVKDE